MGETSQAGLRRDQEALKHMRWNQRQLPGMMQALAGMPEVWPQDATSCSLEELGLYT